MKIIRNYLWSFVILAIFIITSCSDSSGSSGNEGTTDLTAPEWITGYPKPIQLDDRIYVKAALNEKGRVCCVIVPDGAPAPSPQQIADGQNSSGALVPERAHVDVDANETGTLMIAGLVYSSEYDLYCIALDDSQNRQESAAFLDISVSERNTIFVSKTDGDDSYPGTIFQPKKTIQSGISTANALSSSTKRVCVSQGTYVESGSLANGVSLLGGYSKFDWSERDIEDRTNSACFTVISGMGAVSYALAINGTNPGTGDWVIEGFTIESNDSNNSIGIWCYANSPVKIRYNTIDGGAGVDGSVGIYLSNSTSTELLGNTINGGKSTNGDTCGILVETSGDQLIQNNSINGGEGYSNQSVGIKITNPVDYGTIIVNNNINAGVSHDTFAVYITHTSNDETSTPLIYQNEIYVGTGINVTVGVYALIESGATNRYISPVVCNNLIESGSGSDSYGIAVVNINGQAYLYNNTIRGNAANFCGVFIYADDGITSIASIINNIISGFSCAILEVESGICGVLKNNDIYSCTYYFESDGTGVIDSIVELNVLRAEFSGNVPDDALLDDAWNFSASSPASVTGGGLDLSSYPYFQENSSGQKIDMTGKVRTAPWSIGAYENE